ncbi:MAG TPA: hypothetical protein VFG04_09250 [Planctomycetaceae bacterium]|nr:hypothetical protein [Planctomycetaceae bacterium]
MLDDEAELCPFCGAPLKKGASSAVKAAPAQRPTAPSSRPASSSKGPSSKTPAAPAGASPSRPSPTNKPAPSGRPGDPGTAKKSFAQEKEAAEVSARNAANEALSESFQVDTSAGRDVPAASRQRSQTRSYKVRCPMCETVGYVPRSSAGKDIRCANRECMVPIFTAPRPEKKVEEEEVRPKRLTAKNILLSLSAVAFLAFAGWNFFRGFQDTPKGDRKKEESTVVNPGNRPPVTDKSKEPTDVVAGPVAAKPLTVDEERGPALALMSIAAEDKSHNRSRPLSERLTAHTAVDCGNLEMAGKFLDQLQKAENGLSFYRVSPLTAIAWRQLKSGDRAAAAKTLDDSLSAAADLPIEGVFSINSTASLAAALTVAGREKNALALLQKYPSSGPTGRLAAAEVRATAWNTYDIDLEDGQRPLIDAASIQLPIAVEITVAAGYPKEALQLAQSAPDPSLKTECEVAWLEAVQRAKSGHDNKPAAAPDADAVLAKLPPAAQARCHARFGLLKLRDKDRAGAETELKAALAALGSAKAGHEFQLPSVEEVYRWQPSDPGPARRDALAFAEIAHLQAGLGQTENANRNLGTALDCLRASAPSPSAVDAKERINRGDRAGLRSRLRAALKLSESRVEQAASQYGTNLKTLGEAANTRFGLEVEILDTALSWAEPAEVWKLIGKRMTAGDPDRREPFLTTPLPWLLIVRLKFRKEAGDADHVAAIEKVVADTPANPVARLAAAIPQAKEGDPSDLVTYLKSIEGAERSDRERIELILADRLIANGQFAKAFEFTRKLEDPVMKEEGMLWSTALACRLGQAQEVKQVLRASNSSFLPTELVSAWRGFLIGLLARETVEPAATTESASATPAPAAPASGTQAPHSGDSKHAEPSKG